MNNKSNEYIIKVFAFLIITDYYFINKKDYIMVCFTIPFWLMGMKIAHKYLIKKWLGDKIIKQGDNMVDKQILIDYHKKICEIGRSLWHWCISWSFKSIA